MSDKIKADINAARQTICSAISDWTQTDYSYGDPIPTVVNGAVTGCLKQSLLTKGERINRIIRPVILAAPSSTEEIETLKKLKGHSELTLKDIENLTDAVRSKLGKITDKAQNLSPSETIVQTKIIAAIGTIQTAEIALRQLHHAAGEVIASGQSKRVKKQGPPKNEVAHTVAYEFSRLYFDITQMLPTYADGTSGPSGKVSPKLTQLFEKLAISADIRRPLEAAIDRIEKERK